MESSQQPPRLTARQKLLIKLLAFIGLALLLYLKPRVEAWVESRQQNQQTANKPSDSVAETSSTTAPSPWKKSGKSEPRSREADASEPRESSKPTETSEPSDGTDDSLADGKIVASADAAENDGAEDGTESPAAANADVTSAAPEVKKEAPRKKTEKSAESASTKTTPSRKQSSVTKMDRTESAQRRVPDDEEKSNPPPGQQDKSVKDTAAKDTATSALGKLKEIDDNVFESTAGLVYLPGSADGHRLRHVMEHAKDNTTKEIHGVFDGDRDVILAVIDEAFLKAKKAGNDVRSEKQNGRRIYTVNLKRRIGQMGGRQGERQGNPDCRFLRIVLENEVEVVSAYPTKSF